MAQFTRGTTPDITIIIDAFDARGMNSFVTISQGATKILTLTGDRLEVTEAEDQGIYTTTIVLKLTQSETLKFRKGSAEIQARFIDAEENAFATEVGVISINPVLDENVIEYE